jgi:uncharacterized protein
VGYPSVTANVTNNVAVLPSYLGGSVGYRRELSGQKGRVVALAATSSAGAAGGTALLLLGSERLFEQIVPFLILFSCALLAAQPVLSRRLRPPQRENSLRLHAMAFGRRSTAATSAPGSGSCCWRCSRSRSTTTSSA